jgi:hypothetical protein
MIVQKLRIFGLYWLVALALCLVACVPSGTAAPEPPASIPPLPVITATPTPISIPPVASVATPVPVSSAVPTSSPAPVVLPAPMPAGKEAEITLISNKFIEQFPDRVTFAIEGTSVLPIKNITLEYGTNERSIVDEITRVHPTFNPGLKINTSYSWEMKKTGSIPPGAVIWYQWTLIDDAQRTYTSPRQTTSFKDTRFEWTVNNSADMDIYWHDQDSTMIKEMASEVESRLSQLKLEVIIPPERKIKVMVYRDYNEVKSSGLFNQEWTGALAYPSYNIILIPVNSSILDWAKGALPHEITHLLVAEAVFGPFGNLPTWLNEGLAENAKGKMSAEYLDILNKANLDGKLISIRSLASEFPTDPDQAILAYAESHNFVSYLLKAYGWEKIRELLAVFKDGSTYDKALIRVYGSDTSALEKAWRTHIGTH